VRDGSYAATLATAKARIAAFDAKSNESLTLIARGSGSAFETAWVSSSKVVTAQSAASARLDSDAAKMGGLWAGYVDTHRQIRQADNGGQWKRLSNRRPEAAPRPPTPPSTRFDARSGAAR
jgi:hypothetical protein